MLNKNGFYTLKDQDFKLSVSCFEHGERTEKHYHDFYEFVFVNRGFTMHKANDEMCLLLPGDVFFILPGTSHEYWKSVNNSVYNCLFNPEVLGEDLHELEKLPMLDMVLQTDNCARWDKIRLKPDDRHEILCLMKKLELETCQKPSGWTVRSKALLIDFLVSLSRVWSYGRADPTHTDSRPAVTAAGIIRILEQSVKSKTSIEQMARASGYSPDHYTRIFKRLTGLSPSAYITSMRIASAAEKLLDPDVPISSVAESAGFEDVNYFSRLFKKETGKTPTQFRHSLNS